MYARQLPIVASLLAMGITVSSAAAGGKKSCCGPMVSGPVVASPVDQKTPPAAAEPGEAQWDLASSFDVANTPQTLAPNMIGDSLGVPQIGWGDTFYHQHFTKIADNNSPLPQDRISFAYNLYNNAPIIYDPGVTLRSANLDEFTFLAEKTFLGGLASAQLTVPFAHTVAGHNTSNITRGNQATELGNLAITGKALLYQNCRLAISGGLQIELPTREDLTTTDTGEVAANEAWYFTPFAALLVTPNDRLFSQNFISYRMASAANAYADNGAITDHLREANMLMIDTSVGYWVYRDPCARGLTGLAPTLELHYTTTTEDADSLSAPINRVDYLNLTAGCTAEINRNATLATGLVLPLRENTCAGYGQTDRNFDWELAIQLNVRYGNSRR